MSKLKSTPIVPHYKGKQWLDVKLPHKAHDWCHGSHRSIANDTARPKDVADVLRELNRDRRWKFPKRPHFFFSDLHGDPDAFVTSLVASGGVRKIGQGIHDFELTKEGRSASFVIGGDCFDKGPSSLGLLRAIQHLRSKGARVRILAGNHDVRVLFGMVSVSDKVDIGNEHFFIRTGQKIIPLLKEIWDDYLKENEGLKGIPGKKICRNRLYPSKKWGHEFPDFATRLLLPRQIDKELKRIRKKQQTFEKQCEKAGLSLRQVYAAVQKWKELFLEPDGEFFWFFKRMRLMYRSGSFLFLHAGLDNSIASRLHHRGINDINRLFRHALKQAPFDFYYGPLCNVIRTKYRQVDLPFSKRGARHVRKTGVSAVVHGHRNLHHGQRLALRSSMLNFECDTSLDRSTRIKEKVKGRGASVTIINPKGFIIGISTDHPFVKVFHPEETLKELDAIAKKKVA